MLKITMTWEGPEGTQCRVLHCALSLFGVVHGTFYTPLILGARSTPDIDYPAKRISFQLILPKILLAPSGEDVLSARSLCVKGRTMASSPQ